MLDFLAVPEEPEPLDFLEDKEQQVHPDHLEMMDSQETMVSLEQGETQEHQERLEDLDSPEVMEDLVLLETQELLDNLVSPVALDRLDSPATLVLPADLVRLVSLDLPVLMVFLEILAALLSTKDNLVQ